MINKKNFTVLTRTADEWKEIILWGLDNGFHQPEWATKKFTSDAPHACFNSEQEILNANGTEGSLGKLFTFDEFKQKYMKTEETYIVDKAFILEAYHAACPNWQEKIRHKFPKIFENIFIHANMGDRFMDNDGYTYILAQITPGKFCLIDMVNGNRFNDPAPLSEIGTNSNGTYFTKIP